MQQCQSCGMPLSQDPQGGGTEADGTTSTEYCSYCYQSGEFVGDFSSAAEMQAFCKEKLKEQGVKWPLPWLFTRQIPRLKRWRA